jgi:isopenicillin-N N-acyltransferase-like protein
MSHKQPFADAVLVAKPRAGSLQSAIVFILCALSALVGCPSTGIADERPFKEGRADGGQLLYINDLPVMTVAGTPEEIGRQSAALTDDVVRKLVDYPKQFLKLTNRGEKRWQKLLDMSQSLKPQIPRDYRDEMRAFSEKLDLKSEWDAGLLANVIIDLPRAGVNCSSLIVEPARSATGGPLFGRNLDFFTMGMLDKYSLVAVYRPKGKHAFVSVAFPGFFGCTSGMNDEGLALAVHEIYLSADNAPLFNPKGVPYSLCFRRVLEECSTIDDAEKLLRSIPRTTLTSLAVCDRHGAAVFEMTPNTFAVRRAKNGLCFCTNHFRTPELAMFAWCRRYPILEQTQSLKTVGIEDIAKKLDEVNMGRLTVQTMIFEPDPLALHLAIGSCPSSALPLKKLELQPLFKP